MVLYYFSIAFYGARNLMLDQSYIGGYYVGTAVWVLFCAVLILLGSLGIYARLRDARKAEAIILYSLAGTYFLIALIILLQQQATEPSLYLRIITTPLLMAVLARKISHFVVSKRDVEAALKHEDIDPESVR